MKKNNLKYILIIGTVLVWGTIIYKIVQSLSNDSKPVAVKNTIPPKKPNIVDTFSLLQNYADPFVKNLDDNELSDTLIAETGALLTEVQNRSNNNDPLPVQEKPNLPPDFVKYSGYIYNPQKKTQMAMLTIQNQSFAMSENMQINEITVKKISRNSVTIQYRGNTFTIAKSY